MNGSEHCTNCGIVIVLTNIGYVHVDIQGQHKGWLCPRPNMTLATPAHQMNNMPKRAAPQQQPPSQSGRNPKTQPPPLPYRQLPPNVKSTSHTSSAEACVRPTRGSGGMSTSALQLSAVRDRSMGCCRFWDVVEVQLGRRAGTRNDKRLPPAAVRRLPPSATPSLPPSRLAGNRPSDPILVP